MAWLACKSLVFPTAKARRPALKVLRANAKQINSEGRMKVAVIVKPKSKVGYVAQICTRYAHAWSDAWAPGTGPGEKPRKTLDGLARAARRRRK